MKKELTEYSEEQIKRIIGIFNAKVLRDFLQHNSKRYQKYYTGFRAEALKMNQLQDKFYHLIMMVHDKMVISFIITFIERWLSEIETEFVKRSLNNNTESNEVLADVLLDSVFSNDFTLYFDLENDGHVEREITDVVAKSAFLQKVRAVDQKYKIEIETIKVDCEEKIQSNLSKVQDEQNEIHRKHQSTINQLIANIALMKKDKQVVDDMFNDSESKREKLDKELKENYLRVSNLIAEIKEKDNLLSTYATNLNEKNVLIEKYIADLEKLSDSVQKLENYKEKVILECDFAKVSQFKKIESAVELTLDHFKEELDENFYNIGFESLDALYLSELIYHAIVNKLPIFSNVFLADSLVKCISATVDGGAYIKIAVTDEIKFNTNFTNFIKCVPEKVIQIDCFLGKYDESNLLNLLRDCSDLKKIFILSLIYDKQVKYIPVEILNYAEYIALPADLINEKEERLHYFHIANLETVSEDNATCRNKFSKLADMLKVDKNYISVRGNGMLSDKTILAYCALQLIPFLKINRGLEIRELIDLLGDESISAELRKVFGNG